MHGPIVLLVDDHPLFRDGFAAMTRALRPAWRLRVAGCAAEAMAALAGPLPDLMVIDVVLPDDDGFALIARAAAVAPSVPPLIVSGRDDEAVWVRARASGARGFIHKTARPEAMVAAMDAVIAGGTAFAGDERPATLPVLTTRQAEVLMLLAQGHGNKEIRYRLDIAERTVRAHLTELFQLLGAHSRTQAVIRARDLGLVSS